MDKLISRRDAINAVSEITTTMSVCTNKDECYGMKRMQKQALTELENLPSAEPEVISKWKKEFREYVDSLDIARDDWKGIIEYIDELPSAQPETAKRIVGKSRGGMTLWYQCDMCNEPVDAQDNYCRGCGTEKEDSDFSKR